MVPKGELDADIASPRFASAPPRLSRQDPGHSSLLDVAYQDFCQRQEQGEPVSLETFPERYPSIQSSLHRLLFAHHFLENNVHYLENHPDVIFPLAGETFMGFHLEALLGRGSFSRVFLARDNALGNRFVVLKISRLGVDEAQTLGRIKHANIIPIHSLHSDEALGLSAICMPLCGTVTLGDLQDALLENVGPATTRGVLLIDVARSCSLVSAEDFGVHFSEPSAVLREGTLEDAIGDLALKLFDALSYLHLRGIQHKDLKPTNILLTPAGEPMILDFNLSEDVDRQTKLLGGTLLYMAPEQLAELESGSSPQGNGEKRSDLYSLAVILYELLAGDHPFGTPPSELSSREMKAWLLAKQKDGPASLRNLNPRVPKILADAVERCLAFAPADRFSNAERVCAYLLKGQKTSQIAPAPTWKQNLVRAAAVGSVVILASLAFASGLMHREYLQVDHPQLLTGLYGEVAKVFSPALVSDPGNAQTLQMRGKAYFQSRKTDPAFLSKAAREFQAAEKIKSDASNQSWLGYIAQLQLKPSLAMYHYQEAIKAGSPSYEVLNNLGFVLTSANNPEEAVKVLTQAIALEPTKPTAYQNRAVANFRLSLKPKQGDSDQLASWKTFVLDQGRDDIAHVLRTAPPAADIYYTAALIKLAAIADNPSVQAEVIGDLRRSLELGESVEGLQKNSAWNSLRGHPAFLSLLQFQSPQPLSKTSSVLALEPRD